MTEHIATPGPRPGTITTSNGTVIAIPAEWVLLPPGDAALTRRVKAAGDHWVVQERKGRRTFSLGVWAPASTIEALRQQLEIERSTESFARRKAADADRRQKTQLAYVEDFTHAILNFLSFHPHHHELAQQLARAVTQHATPVGSGTVARTKMIPIERRAEAAVIAWMRHQTTAYDSMHIPRIKGKRREIRRMLAQKSKQLLTNYRNGTTPDPHCPLQTALHTTDHRQLTTDHRQLTTDN